MNPLILTLSYYILLKATCQYFIPQGDMLSIKRSSYDETIKNESKHNT